MSARKRIPPPTPGAQRSCQRRSRENTHRRCAPHHAPSDASGSTTIHAGRPKPRHSRRGAGSSTTTSLCVATSMGLIGFSTHAVDFTVPASTPATPCTGRLPPGLDPAFDPGPRRRDRRTRRPSTSGTIAQRVADHPTTLRALTIGDTLADFPASGAGKWATAWRRHCACPLARAQHGEMSNRTARPLRLHGCRRAAARPASALAAASTIAAPESAIA